MTTKWEILRCGFVQWAKMRMWILPPTFDDLLPLDGPALFVAELVDTLDPDAWAELDEEPNGAPEGASASKLDQDWSASKRVVLHAGLLVLDCPLSLKAGNMENPE